MSSNSKNTQLLLAGLVAAAALGLVLYYASASSTAKESTATKPTKKLDVDDNPKKPSSSRSVDVTPKKSNLSDTDEKKMHSKIEELDKKGKALFKNKQVGRWLIFCE
jgi:uncharacterized protein HemX